MKLQSPWFGVLVACSVLGLIGLARGQRAQRILVLTPEQEEILGHLSLVYLSDGQGGQVKTIRITGVNVQLVNGIGSTSSANGTGNLIVGYNESGAVGGDDRTGSHNIAVGTRNSFSSWGGLVAGYENLTSGEYATVSGGTLGHASGYGSSISGGQLGHAAGYFSSVAGGCQNLAGGYTSAVSGGIFNQALSSDSTVSGGISNLIRPNSQGASISGGRSNVVEEFAYFSTISGGLLRTVFGSEDWAAGALYQNN